MSFGIYWVIAMGIGVVGFGWFKIRRRRKDANVPTAVSSDATKAA